MKTEPGVAYRSRRKKQIANWVAHSRDYNTFVDGCHLLMLYYAHDDILKADYWTLLEMYRRWTSLIDSAFYYGNAYQINNFVPFAIREANAIASQLLSKKQLRDPSKPNQRRKNWRLDAKQIKLTIDPIRVFERYLPDLKPAGRLYRAKCPWHADDKPSLVVYPDGAAHCFGCGHHVDVFGIVMEMEHCDFASSVSIVAEIGEAH